MYTYIQAGSLPLATPAFHFVQKPSPPTLKHQHTHPALPCPSPL